MSLQQQVSRWVEKLLPSKQPQTVQCSSKTYLEEQGWRRTGAGHGARWDGFYRTRYGSYKGKIECSTPPQFSVKDPPEGLSRHRHRSCFSGRGGGWWSVHFQKKPKDLDSGVAKIERILHEAHLLSQKAG